MSEEHGTENLKKLTAVVIELSNVTDKVLTDKGGVADKFKYAFELVDELMGLSDLSFDGLKKEFEDLSAVERTEMVEYFNAKFDIKSDRTEQAVERSLAFASYLFGAYPMVKELITLIKNKEEAPKAEAPEALVVTPKRSRKSNK